MIRIRGLFICTFAVCYDAIREYFREIMQSFLKNSVHVFTSLWLIQNEDYIQILEMISVFKCEWLPQFKHLVLFTCWDLTFVGDLPGHFEEQQVLHRQLVLLPGRQQPAEGRHGQGT